MSITPERIEEIRKRAAEYVMSPSQHVNDLLAALEEVEKTTGGKWEHIARTERLIHAKELAETQQTITVKQSSIETLTGQLVDETALHAKTVAKLIIAEQTIARYKSALQIIRDNTDDQGAIDCVDEAFGNQEGVGTDVD